MKVLLVNESPHKIGNTCQTLKIIGDHLREHGIEGEILQLGDGPVRGCIGCDRCRT